MAKEGDDLQPIPQCKELRAVDKGELLLGHALTLALWMLFCANKVCYRSPIRAIFGSTCVAVNRSSFELEAPAIDDP